MEGVKLGLGVGETSKGVAETEDVVMVVGVNGNQVGDEVGVKVRVVVGVAVARLFPSASGCMLVTVMPSICPLYQ